jgi:hypothetical protein
VEEKRNNKKYQMVILILADGRKARFIGPEQLFDGDNVVDVQSTEPRLMPAGCEWEDFTLGVSL